MKIMSYTSYLAFFLSIFALHAYYSKNRNAGPQRIWKIQNDPTTTVQKKKKKKKDREEDEKGEIILIQLLISIRYS